jgi:hypothetical protein
MFVVCGELSVVKKENCLFCSGGVYPRPKTLIEAVNTFDRIIFQLTTGNWPLTNRGPES